MPSLLISTLRYSEASNSYESVYLLVKQTMRVTESSAYRTVKAQFTPKNNCS
ncbi:hypothetical protein ATG66_3744 [Vibrio sp. ES.051]|nr:hypothetical protein ATG66_3744 [Vibrio sp. ES.051]